MLHHYIQKGWKIEDFLEIPTLQEYFYAASMEVALEERAAFFKLDTGV